MKDLNFLVIGAGSRGTAYARAITTSTPARISAVAEPDPYKRRTLGEKYIWGTNNTPTASQEFTTWQEWIAYEKNRRSARNNTNDNEGETGITGLLICTLDETHITILDALAKANLLDLHILCEKPLALSLDDCLAVYASHLNSGSPERAARSIFSIGHVLRYSPHNLLLRKLVRQQKVIGEIVSVEHTEPVGYWHFAHSYVRGNWRRETERGDGSLLTKSCHDVDFLLWLIDEPVYEKSTADDNNNNNEARLKLRSISSAAHLTQFTSSRKPISAGNATNCTACPIERECIYSALRIYRDNHLHKGKTGWPLKIVCPDIEDYADPSEAEKYLLDTLKEDYDAETLPDEEMARRTWYGRCVWECDNDVADDQVVLLSWDSFPPSPSTSTSTSLNPAKEAAKKRKRGGGITATLHMIAPTEAQCERRGRIYGTLGEISYDSRRISIYSFATRETTVIEVPKQPPEEEEAHGGGDYGLARGFVGAVDAVENKGWEVERAQREFVGCTLEDVIRSHAVVFAAEESRREERVVKWEGWWNEKLAGVGLNAN
ncbi:hypothetical protein BJX61DRAFT_509776 [Aspergillus egyptiacus]|nr:hypothetical protein BJX61DRAFT_509776 [Aspergillus egyptiacus]